MADYHVGCGIAAIYAGTLKKSGKEWLNKSDATHEALSAVAQYLFVNDKEFRFQVYGHWYTLRVDKLEEEKSEE